MLGISYYTRIRSFKVSNFLKFINLMNLIVASKKLLLKPFLEGKSTKYNL